MCQIIERCCFDVAQLIRKNRNVERSHVIELLVMDLSVNLQKMLPNLYGET